VLADALFYSIPPRRWTIGERVMDHAPFPVLATPLVVWRRERTGQPNRLSSRL